MTTERPVKTVPASKRPGRPPVNPKPPAEPKKAPESVLIHFVNEGFCALGHPWYRGQELEIEKPSADYDRTCDALGNSWLTMPEDEQIERWGEVKFKPGPADIPNSIIDYTVVTGDGVDLQGRPKYKGYNSIVEREIAAKAEVERGRKVPKL